MQDIMPPVNTPDNEFHDGDESTGVEGTILYAQYMNDNQGAIQDIQQEMKNVLADAGFTPDPTKENQLLLAIKKIISTGITTGTEGMVKSVNNKQPDADGNVKLGSAADADIVTSMTDTTVGRVLTTGWMTLGGYGTDNLIAAGDAKKSLRNGFYAVSSEPAYGNASLISFGYDSGSQVHIIAKQGGQTPLLGVCGSTPQGVFGNWGKIYTEFQKPTAGDIGAVAKAGDSMTGKLTMNVDGEALRLQPKTAGYASYILSADSANANHWYVGAGSVGNADVAFNNYKGGNNSVVLKSDGTIYLNPTQGRSAIVNSPLQLGTTKKLTIESQNTSTLGAILHLWGNADRPTVMEFGDDTSYHFYSQRNKDGSISFVSPGEVVPGNYTNFDQRYGQKNTASLAAGGGWWQDASTGLIMQMGIVNRTAPGTGVTFPKAFPNFCMGVLVTLNMYIDSLKDSNSNIRVLSHNNTSFTYGAAGDPEKTSFWVAFGK
ncbi:gp53-like domain-containing protein [Enterobacter ludwigii]|uniref:gp53-like domain-containing protein n=1 Tax=Enterobacter ludwigii TaxID=299767 RepID=UPI003BEEB80C